METIIKVEKKVNIKYVKVNVPVIYGDEDIPYNFPLRDGNTWEALIEVDTGKIIDWPDNEAGEMYMKVCDEGSYYLLNEDMKILFIIEEDYVPNKLIPGEYGDYIELIINKNGIITNWPKYPDISDFLIEE
jgi:hypothetical protein